MTFVYMGGHKKRLFISDSTDDIIKSAVCISDSNQAINESYEQPRNWHNRESLVPFIYIDDTNGRERLLLKNAVQTNTTSRQNLSLHSKSCEQFFIAVRDESSRIGMKINPSKTQMLCVSNAGSPTIESFIRLDDQKITSGETLKICGYTFGSRLTVDEQVKVMIRKFNERSWALRHLKRSGFKTDDLLTSYLSLIRPLFDFTSVVYHPLLSAESSLVLERLQKRALRLIDPNYESYEKTLEKLNITTLALRRRELVGNFIKKSLANPSFTNRWFPLKERHGYDTRKEEKYAEYKCNTERNRRNPLNYYRRLLNADEI